ncbi:uncharacterized protein LOC110815582 [Carica papaya]|uniref:uncharacterized protein LOC110815582 n=1 Tax=Carica papaya TaxID=3649 RepID=UPI000B8D12A1|nr:uncharacterized protein LOC110815582 [Carica papaya]
MVAATAVRSAFMRPIWRKTTNLSASRKKFSIPISNPSSAGNRSTFPDLSLSRLVRRELSTLQPVHSAIASACLVSKLPTDLTTFYQGRFANYISPI